MLTDKILLKKIDNCDDTLSKVLAKKSYCDYIFSYYSAIVFDRLYLSNSEQNKESTFNFIKTLNQYESRWYKELISTIKKDSVLKEKLLVKLEYILYVYTEIRNNKFGHNADVKNENSLSEMESVCDKVITDYNLFNNEYFYEDPVLYYASIKENATYLRKLGTSEFDDETTILHHQFDKIKNDRFYLVTKLSDHSTFIELTPFIRLKKLIICVLKKIVDLDLGKGQYSLISIDSNSDSELTCFDENLHYYYYNKPLDNEFRLQSKDNCDFNFDSKRKIPGTGTIYSNFEKTKFYYTLPFYDKVNDFLSSFNSGQSILLLQGSGGYGKTTTVKKIIEELIVKDKIYDKIVFASAKDEQYEEKDEKTIKIAQIVNTYETLLYYIYKIFTGNEFGNDDDKNSNSSTSDEIINYLKNDYKVEPNYRSLIIIDDFETFPTPDRISIIKFINNLPSSKFRFLITSRDKNAELYSISTDKLDENNAVDFLCQYISNDDTFVKTIPKKILEEIIIEFENNYSFRSNYYNITKGMPLLIKAFAGVLFRGYKDFKNIVKEVIDQKVNIENAYQFIYAKNFERLDGSSKKVFLTIGYFFKNNPKINISIQYLENVTGIKNISKEIDILRNYDYLKIVGDILHVENLIRYSIIDVYEKEKNFDGFLEQVKNNGESYKLTIIQNEQHNDSFEEILHSEEFDIDSFSVCFNNIVNSRDHDNVLKKFSRIIKKRNYFDNNYIRDLWNIHNSQISTFNNYLYFITEYAFFLISSSNDDSGLKKACELIDGTIKILDLNRADKIYLRMYKFSTQANFWRARQEKIKKDLSYQTDNNLKSKLHKDRENGFAKFKILFEEIRGLASEIIINNEKSKYIKDIDFKKLEGRCFWFLLDVTSKSQNKSFLNEDNKEFGLITNYIDASPDSNRNRFWQYYKVITSNTEKYQEKFENLDEKKCIELLVDKNYKNLDVFINWENQLRTQDKKEQIKYFELIIENLDELIKTNEDPNKMAKLFFKTLILFKNQRDGFIDYSEENKLFKKFILKLTTFFQFSLSETSPVKDSFYIQSCFILFLTSISKLRMNINSLTKHYGKDAKQAILNLIHYYEANPDYKNCKERISEASLRLQSFEII